MPSNWTKQPQFLTQKFFNDGSGDATVGGALTGVPSAIGASQGDQTLPGDRIILGSADALALSDTAVGTLYGGLYMYVRTPSGSTKTPTRAHIAFWDTSVADSQYQVTPDETGTDGANLIAGVFINTLTKGNSWWILIAGKVVGQFRATLTGTAANGCGVYAAAEGNGVFDVLAGSANQNATQIDNMMMRFMGVAENLPSNNNASLVDVPLQHVYRW